MDAPHRRRQGPPAAQHPRAVPPFGAAANPLRHALGHAPDRRRRSDPRQPRHADPRRERRRGGRRPLHRARRRAEEDAAERRRRSALRRRRGLRQELRRAVQGRPARLAVLRRASAERRLPPDLRRAVGHDRRQGPEHPAGRQLDASGAGSGEPRLAEGRRHGLRPRVHLTRRATTSPTITSRS